MLGGLPLTWECDRVPETATQALPLFPCEAKMVPIAKDYTGGDEKRLCRGRRSGSAPSAVVLVPQLPHDVGASYVAEFLSLLSSPRPPMSER